MTVRSTWARNWRAAHRRLRGLLGRLALGPAPGHELRGAHHAGRGLASRHDRAAQANGRPGARVGPLGPTRRRAAANRQRGADGRGPGRLVARRRHRRVRYPCEPMDAEDLLYLLYTSGTTAKPKGIAHTTAGYLAGVATTHYYIFDVKPDSVYWCAADVGWVTGHSYIVYGPLANGTTGVMYEGTPDYPDKDRWWEIVERYQVDILYTAPTAIRSHMKWGPSTRRSHDLSSPAAARVGRRADQPGGLGLVLRAHRRRALPRRGHLVADRDGDDHDHAAPGRDDAEAGLGDQAVPGRRCGRLQRAGRGGRAGRRRVPGAAAPVAGDAPRPLQRARTLRRDLLVEVPGRLLRG